MLFRSEPIYWLCGGRRKGGMNTVQAFIWNVGTYGLVLRESAKWTNRKVQSTDTVIGAEWLVVVKRVSEKKTERRSHSIQAE